jgi:adenine-specific DNA-methyltransferase
MSLQPFSQPQNFLPALKAVFKDLNVPINYVADEPTTAKDILKDTYKDNETFQLVEDVYFVGMVDDAAFEGNPSLDAGEIKSDYDGILIFGVRLKERPNGLLPTRSQLAEISRAFNREFYYTPVVVVFQYGGYLAFANTERLKYKQEWREGEKAGKVSLLRDIHIETPHSGHTRILAELQIPNSGSKKVDSFAKLYSYWQEVFSVSLLNKKFYQELSNWYFWATQEVTFPNQPTAADAQKKNAKLDDLLQEHRATNVIRMLTRLLFVWFIKEKKLIPDSLFELDALQNDILKDFSPYHETGVFKEQNKASVYYKAILQNLFFATLNCPIQSDNLDNRKRGFRGDGYGTHRGIDYLMRYKKHFKDPDAFLGKMNQTVPFLNGGLFECLDDKLNNIYIDGFSDNMTKGQQLIVPDYLFFGVEEETDLSAIVGISDKKYKQAAVKGLINILKSYKFTITENTPIEEDVALDPELLGKVFENLLASYNPETKTTARKQTGSFYTPREIVNYMVDESLIAYLKNKITTVPSVFLEFGTIQTNMFGNEGKIGQMAFVSDLSGSELKNDEMKLDTLLHELVSFNPGNPFAQYPNTTKQLLQYLSTCAILDPACGSGAFPMGILQKMVHILQKLDPDNKVWKEVQLAKAEQDSKAAFEIEDKKAREERLLEINEAFDQSINDPDYARKLFLIENCIYGVDIQPIATQISKLRFFISLVVEQKVNADKDNFGIRPLPNLETKFVAANTLIGIEKPSAQLNMFDTKEVKALEAKLKKVRSKLFSARSKDTKLKYREEDKVLRNQIAEELEKSGWKSDTAQKLATWDPYDQNASSSFFDPEWMFDIQDGFDVVIGNPPYLRVQGIRETNPNFADWLSENYESATGSFDLYAIFTERGIQLSKKNGLVNYIMPVKWTNAAFGKGLREFLLKKRSLSKIISFDEFQVFNASTYTGIQLFQRESQSLLYNQLNTNLYSENALNSYLQNLKNSDFNKYDLSSLNADGFTLTDDSTGKILNEILKHKLTVQDVFEKIFQGIATSKDSVYFLTNCVVENDFVTGFSKELNKTVSVEKGITKPLLKGDQVHKYKKLKTDNVVLFPYRLQNSSSSLMTEIEIKQNYPLAYQYLKANETTLRNREKGRLINDTFWFRYIYPKNQNLFELEKLMAPDVSMGGNFTYDFKGEFYSTTTVYGYIKKKSVKESYWYLMSILNSQVLWWYLKNTGAVMANGYFRFKPDYLKPFNLPEPNAVYEVELLSTILYASGKSSKHFEQFNSIVNALIFNLYFPDHMKERGIDVLEFVERDIAAVMQGREFDELSGTEKEQVIEQLHAAWSDPDNEVRNRIKLFAVRSPEILKPILES